MKSVKDALDRKEEFDAIRRAFGPAPGPISDELVLQNPGDDEWQTKSCGCTYLHGRKRIQKWADGFEAQSYPELRYRRCDACAEQLELDRTAMRKRLMEP